MRVVLDTNVVVSALIWGGTPYKLIEAAVRGDLDLCTSPALIAELRGVLARDRLAQRLGQLRGPVDEAIALYVGLAISVSPIAVPQVVLGDPPDDQVIAAAVAAGAELIVSGDRDLLTLGRHGGAHIVTPAGAVSLLGIL